MEYPYCNSKTENTSNEKNNNDEINLITGEASTVANKDFIKYVVKRRYNSFI